MRSAGGLPCPECGSIKSKVTDSRAINRFTRQPCKHRCIRRRRECANGHRFTTYETNENTLSPPQRLRLAEARFGNGYD
jgi:transcriptional regulator NrdR family protein